MAPGLQQSEGSSGPGRERYPMLVHKEERRINDPKTLVLQRFRERNDATIPDFTERELRIIEEAGGQEFVRKVLVEEVQDLSDEVKHSARAVNEEAVLRGVNLDVQKRTKEILAEQAAIERAALRQLEGLDSRAATTVSVESALIPEALRREVVEICLPNLQQVLQGLPVDVYSSIAMYLHGKEMEGTVEAKYMDSFRRPPGDFDANAHDEATLIELQNRLLNGQGFTFELDHPPGQWKNMKDGISVLSGNMVVGVDVPGQGMQRLGFPVEIYLNTPIIPDTVETVAAGGFARVITPEGLRDIYENNYDLEKAVEEDVLALAEDLVEPEMMQKNIDLIRRWYTSAEEFEQLRKMSVLDPSADARSFEKYVRGTQSPKMTDASAGRRTQAINKGRITRWIAQQDRAQGRAQRTTPADAARLEQLDSGLSEFMEDDVAPVSDAELVARLKNFYSDYTILEGIDQQLISEGFSPGMYQEYRELKQLCDYPKEGDPSTTMVQRQRYATLQKVVVDTKIAHLLSLRNAAISEISKDLGPFKTKVNRREDYLQQLNAVIDQRQQAQDNN